MLNLSYETFTLSNGLKVVVHEDKSLPKVVVNILYRVGSKDEEESLTGFAHLFEHLMFEGSKHIPHYDKELQRVGGDNNAFTSADITNYYLSMPSNQLETAFWLESDRMLALDISQEKLAIQQSVVIEEYKQRYLNQPYGDAYLHLLPLHFEKHPYRWATIGKSIEHVAQASLKDVEQFFYGFYAPNNAVMVVAGDVRRAEVERLAEKWFGNIPERPLKKNSLPAEPLQSEAKRKEVTGNVPFPAVYKMFHIPAYGERDYFTLDLISDLLSNGKGAWLYEDLIKKHKVATSVSAFVWGHLDPGAFSINGYVSENASTEEYESQLRNCLDRLAHLPEQELTRVKNKVEASFILQKTQLLEKAMAFAYSDAAGDLSLVNKVPEIYRSITVEDIYRVTQHYLQEKNCSTLLYIPQK